MAKVKLVIVGGVAAGASAAAKARRCSEEAEIIICPALLIRSRFGDRGRGPGPKRPPGRLAADLLTLSGGVTAWPYGLQKTAG